LGKPVEPQAIGEHIRRLRMKRHASVRSFAAQTGFSPSFISQLENGQVSPSLGSMQKIAEALGVTLGEFFAAAATDEESLVVRLGDRRRVDSTWTDAHIESLGPMGRSRRLEPVLAMFGPGGKSGKHTHSNPHEEFAFVVKGQVTLSFADEEHTLESGDGVTLPAHAPHRWENRSEGIVEIVIVSSRTRG
jgi:quercetin dioxygenase-like cupin family protein/DNA-binding XRE family transcriptional regulator